MWDVFDLWFCVELGLFLYFFSVCTSSSKSTQFLEWFPQAHFKFVTEAVEQECLKKKMPEQCSPWARSYSPQTYVMLRFLDPGHLCHSSPRAFMESQLVMLARQIPVRSWTSSDLNTLSVKVSKGIVLWTPSIKLKPACLTLNGMQESFVNLLWLVVEACLVEQFWSFLMLPSKDTASNLDPSNKVVISYYSVSSVLCTQKHRGVGKLQNPLSYKSTSVTFAAKAVLMCRGFSRSSG